MVIEKQEKEKGQPILKNRYRTMPARRVAFIAVRAGIVLQPDGERLDLGQSLTMKDVLEVVEAEDLDVVYIVGCWNAASTPRTEWFVAPETWERATYHRNPLVASYRKKIGGRKVSVYGSAQWFGQCGKIELVMAAYKRLQALVKGAFGDHAFLLGTPARTGLDLVERSLPLNRDKVPYEWPVLPQDVREIIEHNIGQGRMEMLRQGPKTPQADRLYIQDAFWLYAALCRRLPSGPCQHDTLAEFGEYRPGFYRVLFQVPVEWRHIGLLPTWNPKDRKTVWPSRPSTYWYESVCCPEELRLAQEQNWPVQIKERWLWNQGDDLAHDPLRNWIGKLREMRDRVTAERDGAEIAPLLRSAIRSLVIKAIGGLHRKGRYRMMETPMERLADIPEDADIVWQTDQIIRWHKPIPLDSHMAHFAHPEWSATIWGRARALLARRALEVPRECIIALRSDAMALTFDPGWKAEKPGQFRLKRTIELAGRALPVSTRDYLDLLQDEEED